MNLDNEEPSKHIVDLRWLTKWCQAGEHGSCSGLFPGKRRTILIGHPPRHYRTVMWCDDSCHEIEVVLDNPQPAE